MAEIGNLVFVLLGVTEQLIVWVILAAIVDNNQFKILKRLIKHGINGSFYQKKVGIERGHQH